MSTGIFKPEVHPRSKFIKSPEQEQQKTTQVIITRPFSRWPQTTYFLPWLSPVLLNWRPPVQ